MNKLNEISTGLEDAVKTINELIDEIEQLKEIVAMLMIQESDIDDLHEQESIDIYK